MAVNNYNSGSRTGDDGTKSVGDVIRDAAGSVKDKAVDAAQSAVDVAQSVAESINGLMHGYDTEEDEEDAVNADIKDDIAGGSAFVVNEHDVAGRYVEGSSDGYSVRNDDGTCHYEGGSLGTFDYDPSEWRISVHDPEEGSEDNVSKLYLKYTGTETDGAKIQIPEGLESLDYTFEGNETLESVPAIPDSVHSAVNAFADCKSLTHFSDACERSDTGSAILPENLDNITHMFVGSSMTESYSMEGAAGQKFAYSEDSSYKPFFMQEGWTPDETTDEEKLAGLDTRISDIDAQIAELQGQKDALVEERSGLRKEMGLEDEDDFSFLNEDPSDDEGMKAFGEAGLDDDMGIGHGGPHGPEHGHGGPHGPEHGHGGPHGPEHGFNGSGYGVDPHVKHSRAVEMAEQLEDRVLDDSIESDNDLDFGV